MVDEKVLEHIGSWVPDITSKQKEQLASLADLYRTWNSRLNLISRKDLDQFSTRHLLHCCSIAQWYSLSDKKILDVGSGGGLPGIPMAILFPDAQFTLVDSVGKKMSAVRQIAHELELTNVQCVHERVEKLDINVDFVLGRAVTALPRFFDWVQGHIDWSSGKGQSGILYLKGGDFLEELELVNGRYVLHELGELSEDPFFETKKLLHIYR